MEYRQFIVPTDTEILDALGVVPEIVEGEDPVRLIRISTEEGDDFRLSYDVPGRSIRCQWNRESSLLLDLTREGADYLRVSSDRNGSSILIHFQVDSLSGELHIQLTSSVTIRDKLLFC